MWHGGGSEKSRRFHSACVRRLILLFMMLNINFSRDTTLAELSRAVKRRKQIRKHFFSIFAVLPFAFSHIASCSDEINFPCEIIT